MNQEKYLIEKIARNGTIESMVAFIDAVWLDLANVDHMNEQVRPMGYVVNVEEVEEMQAQREKMKIINCKNNCRRNVFVLPDDTNYPQGYIRYFVPFEQADQQDIA